MEQATILVVDDDREIVGAIAKLLELDGHRVLRAYDGLEALEILHEQTVHLIILDVMMPRMDGLSATMQVRREKNVPILLLSAKTEDADKIAGLSIGADDYMTKPYNPMELAARVKALLRRYMTLGTVAGAPARPGVIQLGGRALDTQPKILEVDGAPVRLTATEYRIVQFLIKSLLSFPVNQRFRHFHAGPLVFFQIVSALLPPGVHRQLLVGGRAGILLGD